MTTRPAHYNVRPKQNLSPRQREVLELIAEGHTNGQIATRLGIGLESVKTHVSDILYRLGVETREQAAIEWRHYNSLGGRFRRALNGVAALFTTRAAMATGAVAVTGIIAAGAIGLFLSLRSDGEPNATATSADASPTPQTTPTTGPTPSALARWRKTADIQVALMPSMLAEAAGSIWVTSQAADTVSRIDPATNTVTATIEVGRKPTHISSGLGYLWVGNVGDGTISRIDPATNQVTATITLPGPILGDAIACWLDVLPREDGIWVSHAVGRAVLRYDPESLELRGSTPISLGEPGDACPLSTLNEVGGFLWLDVFDVATVQLDLQGTILREWSGIEEVTLLVGQVWGDDYVNERRVILDPLTGQIIGEAPYPGRAIDRIVQGEGTVVWSTANKGAWAIAQDLATGEVHRVRTGAAVSGILVAFDSVWVANGGDHTVSRISQE